MKLKIPWGAFDVYGCWMPNEKLDMTVAKQYQRNVDNGYIPKHRPKPFTANDITLERRQIFQLGLATDMTNSYYELEYIKAKIREQPFFEVSK